MLSYEARQLVADGRRRSGSSSARAGWARGVANQSIFHLSQFTLLLHDFERDGNNLGLAYFHGRPGTPGMPEFDACFDSAARATRRDRPHPGDEPRDGGARARRRGSPPEKVHRIPIGIDTDVFRPRTTTPRRLAARAARPAGTRVRRRLVPEGRRRLGRGARAEARSKGPTSCSRSPSASAEHAARALRPAHRSGARLRPLGARAPRHPVPPPAPARRRRGRGRCTRRSTSASSPRVTRAGRGRCSSRWRRGCRS